MVVWLSVPLVPTIVSVCVPRGVFRCVVTVITEEPDPATDGGLKLALTPRGSPLALNVTVPANPPEGVTVTVYVVLWPRTTVCEGGAALSVKSPPTAVTLRVMSKVWTSEPLVPRAWKL